jgi:hypothetical protein
MLPSMRSSSGARRPAGLMAGRNRHGLPTWIADLPQKRNAFAVWRQDQFCTDAAGGMHFLVVEQPPCADEAHGRDYNQR